jgi:glycosyltransferase involved in cell wall biosynthesis
MTRATFLGPADWDEESYLSCNPDVRAAVERGDLRSGLEHWHRRGRFEGRTLVPRRFEKRKLRRSNMPTWLKSKMLAVSEIEPKLFPSEAFCAAAAEYRPMKDSGAGLFYGQLLDDIGGRSFTHVFLLAEAGDVELESIHHISTLSARFGARILVILTEDSDSPWPYRLPENATALHFGRKRTGIDQGSAQVVLARLLLKLKPPVIHNTNSAIGWQIFCRYGAALCSESKLYASLPCFEYTLEGEPFGYGRELEKAYPYLSGVFSDNQAFPAKLREMHGIRADLFSVMRYPVSVAPRFKFTADGRPKILWASRLDRQKRPDILQRIAESLPECMFHVYGASPPDTSREIAKTCRALRRLNNVIMFGGYDGFDAIPTANYALFLYTTQWDGLPNVILEAMAGGLAVLAPDVGGIGEVITPNSEFLIPRFDDVKGYVGAIRHLNANPQLIVQQRDRGLQYLRENHSSEAFVASLAKLSAYTMSEPRPKGVGTIPSETDDIFADTRGIRSLPQEPSIGFRNSD